MTSNEFDTFVSKKCKEAGADYAMCTIGAEIIESLWRYVIFGTQPGAFLTSVLENDLRGATGRTDVYDVFTLKAIVSYIYQEIPSVAWGAPERVAEWRKLRADEAKNA